MLQNTRPESEIGLRLPHDAAVLPHEQRGEFLGACGQDVGSGEQLLRSLFRRNTPPDGEGGVGLLDRAVHVVRRAHSDLSDDVVEATGID